MNVQVKLNILRQAACIHQTVSGFRAEFLKFMDPQGVKLPEGLWEIFEL